MCVADDTSGKVARRKRLGEVFVVIDLTEVVYRTHNAARIVAAADRTVVRIARYADHVLDGVVRRSTIVAHPTYDTARTISRRGIDNGSAVGTIRYVAGILLFGDDAGHISSVTFNIGLVCTIRYVGGGESGDTSDNSGSTRYRPVVIAIFDRHRLAVGCIVGRTHDAAYVRTRAGHCSIVLASADRTAFYHTAYDGTVAALGRNVSRKHFHTAYRTFARQHAHCCGSHFAGRHVDGYFL